MSRSSCSKSNATKRTDSGSSPSTRRTVLALRAMLTGRSTSNTGIRTRRVNR
ncbi:Uncharacterised protein [Mycobacterium tuberculosis]|nr:Uncharacterised protein [Mycobacterium tuberculosis]CPA71255.1 Uncharacterised protein [Mycobacterium tuberculosis]